MKSWRELKGGQGKTKTTLLHGSIVDACSILPGSRKPYSELFFVCLVFCLFICFCPLEIEHPFPGVNHEVNAWFLSLQPVAWCTRTGCWRMCSPLKVSVLCSPGSEPAGR